MARRTPAEARPLDLEDATPYVASLFSVEYQPASEAHPDWPDQFKFVWSIDDGNGDTQELWTWASIKLGQTKGGKVAKLRTILNSLAGRKSADPIAWLEDGSDGEDIAWGYPDGQDFVAEKGMTLRIIGHTKDTGDGGSKFVVDTYASAKSTRAAAPAATPAAARVKVGAVEPVAQAARAPREEVAAEAIPF